MKKRTRNRLIIVSTAVLLVATLILLTGFTVDILTNGNIFDCNTVYTTNTSGNSECANAAIEKFAKEHNLSLSEWPEELVQLLNKNSETEDFVLNYPLLKDVDQDINLDDCDYNSSVPLFMQWDKRWGYTPYGDDIIAIAGCGPTCLSMVSVYLLKDTSYNPKYISEFSENNGYCVPGNGTAWSFMSDGASSLGLCSEELCLDENVVKNRLEAGQPIICIMGKGDFTDEGHYIVMTDYVDGQIKVNDPNSIARSEKLWNFEDIKDQINNLWAYSVY